MLKIGDFSKLAHVSVKTLRHYDRLGLLRPVWTDRYTGYRYYSLEQLPPLNRILALKDMGFSLEHIRILLDEDLPPKRLHQMFDQKQEELRQRLIHEQVRLERVAERLRQIELEGRMPEYEVSVKSIPAQTVACLRASIISLEDLPGWSSLMRALISDGLTKAGLRPAGPWMVIYHGSSYNERGLDVEVARVLESFDKLKRVGKSSPQNFTLRVLPAVECMASLLHQPAWGPLSSTYVVLYSWMDRAGYQVIGPTRELFLDDPDLSPKQMGSPCSLTEIQIPVESSVIHKQKLLANPYRKEVEMEPKFVTLPAFKVIGMRYFGKNENQEIKQLWEQANPRFGEIKNISSQNAYGICSMVEGAAPGEFEYVASLEVSKVDEVPKGMVAREVPASKYAVFTHVGSLEKLKDTIQYIYHTWLPQSGHELTGGPDFELYNQDFKDFAPDSRFYIYVPVK